MKTTNMLAKAKTTFFNLTQVLILILILILVLILNITLYSPIQAKISSATSKTSKTSTKGIHINNPTISGNCKMLGKSKIIVDQDKQSFWIEFDNFGFVSNATANKFKRINCTIAMPIVVSKNVRVSLPHNIYWHFDSNLDSSDNILFNSEYFFAGESGITLEQNISSSTNNTKNKQLIIEHIQKQKQKTKTSTQSSNDCGKSKIFRINLSLNLKQLKKNGGFLKLKVASGSNSNNNNNTPIKFPSNTCVN
ncbi:MAG: DUF4360 domain-containing protein [Oligoflexia bacterium]|nr:DUF4360 domain-containing protein [Oligoflexia bacterium]